MKYRLLACIAVALAILAFVVANHIPKSSELCKEYYTTNMWVVALSEKIMPVVCIILFVLSGIAVALAIIKETAGTTRTLAISGIILLLLLWFFISYFVILSPKTLIPARCTMSAEFQCYEHCAVYAAGNITIVTKLINQMGTQVTVNNVSGDYREENSNRTLSCSFSDTIIEPGEKFNMICTAKEEQKSERIKAQMGFAYTEQGRAYPLFVSLDLLEKPIDTEFR